MLRIKQCVLLCYNAQMHRKLYASFAAIQQFAMVLTHVAVLIWKDIITSADTHTVLDSQAIRSQLTIASVTRSEWILMLSPCVSRRHSEMEREELCTRHWNIAHQRLCALTFYPGSPKRLSPNAEQSQLAHEQWEKVLRGRVWTIFRNLDSSGNELWLVVIMWPSRRCSEFMQAIFFFFFFI